jgi:N-dimethylarginine dimethylaminohydrolase
MARFSVDSEYGVLHDVLVCRPEHFEWLPVNTTGIKSVATGESVDRKRVLAQHDEMVDALRQADVTVHYVEPQPHLQYMVYTRDSSQMTPWGPVINQMHWRYRWGEFKYLADFYASSGEGVFQYITHGSIEGGDISVMRPGLAVVGVSGVRTTEEGASQFLSWFEKEGWETRIVPFDDFFCHLDVIFTMVSERLALACPEVLDDDFIRWLGDHDIEIIPATYREAMALQCNVLALGKDRVISPRKHTEVNTRLRAAGIEVLDPDLSEIIRGGGSAHCTTQALIRDGG